MARAYVRITPRRVGGGSTFFGYVATVHFLAPVERATFSSDGLSVKVGHDAKAADALRRLAESALDAAEQLEASRAGEAA